MVRPATEEDIPVIARILVNTWRTTFTGLLSDEFLTSLSEHEQQNRYRKFLSKADCCCLVAEREDVGVVGFACGGPNRSATVSTAAELYALYVMKDHQGSGIGRRLFDVAARRLLTALGHGLSVWVIENNPFRLFYTHRGGMEATREELEFGRDIVTQVAYTWLEA